MRNFLDQVPRQAPRYTSTSTSAGSISNSKMKAEKMVAAYVPLGSKSAQAVMNSPRWCEPRMEESLMTIIIMLTTSITVIRVTTNMMVWGYKYDANWKSEANFCSYNVTLLTRHKLNSTQNHTTCWSASTSPDALV